MPKLQRIPIFFCTLLAAAVTPVAAQQNELVMNWQHDLRALRGALGRRVAIVCPPGGEPTRVFGTDNYTDDSSTCSAAVHAGVITAEDGGPVVVIIGPARGSFKASTQNGVTSQSYGSWPGSISFDKTGAIGQVDWVTRAKGIWQTLTVSCPPGGAPGTVWGSDPYTEDSSICGAAAHAGVITIADGGPVTVAPAPGLQSYPASERNGVASTSYAAWPASIKVSRGSATPSVAVNVAAPPVPATPAPAVQQAPPVQQTAPVKQPASVPATSATMPGTQAKTGVNTPPQKDNKRSLGTSSDAPPSAPANVAIQYLSGGRVALTWDAVPGAVSYDIISNVPGSSSRAGVNLEPIMETQHVSRSLTEGAYTMTVVANMSGTTAGPFSPESQPVSVNVPRWYGKYRITINGFRVNHETADNVYETDGKRDEIYVRAVTTVMHALGQKINTQTVKSLTHGDINAPRWQNSSTPAYRIKAGSASNLGGLMTGDGYPDRLMPWKRSSDAYYNHTFPLLVWEGDIMEDVYHVVVVPSIIEDDEVQADIIAQQYMDMFEELSKPVPSRKQMNSEMRNMMAPVYEMITDVLHRTPGDARDFAQRKLNTMGAGNPVAQARLSAMPNMFSAATAAATRLMSVISLAANNQDRPIGLTKLPNGANTYDPPSLYLDFKGAERVIAGTATGSLEPGILKIEYKDAVVGGNGDYTLFLEVRRIN